jgi:uncharacterized repeat protein (TIGR04138 family)
MSRSMAPLLELLKRDRRYRLQAYVFVYEALEYAHRVLGLGRPQRSERPAEEQDIGLPEEAEGEPAEQHLTGQELCEAIRRYALEQFGYMAKTVFNQWGVYSTSDFGEIVYNLISIGKMSKTPEDRREDFDNVFDFEEGLTRSFRMKLPP